MATTTQSPYTVGVRKALNEMGVSDERISYDPNTGYVKVDGVNVIKPQLNVEGTTYTTEADINSIRGDVNRLNRMYQLQSQVLNPQQQQNPYDEQISQLLSTIQQRVQNPTPIDPYSTPAYAAAQAQAQRQAQQATRSAQEALGASGLGRSSVLADRAQRIQQNANEYLMTQVVPQIVAQEQARQQQELANLFNILNALGQQQQLVDTRGQRQFANAFDVLNFLEDQAYRQQQMDEARRLRNINAWLEAAARTGYLATSPVEDYSLLVPTPERIAAGNFIALPEELQRQFQNQLAQREMDLAERKFEFSKQESDRDYELRKKQLEAQLANMAAENARAAARLAMEQEEFRNNKRAREFLGRLMDDLGELDNEQDIRDFLRLNAGEISSILGVDTYNRILQSALEPFEQQRAAQGDIYQQAVRLAQSDPNWQFADQAQRQSLIEQYVRMLGG